MHHRPPQSSPTPPGQANRFCDSVIQRAFGSQVSVLEPESTWESSVTETLTFQLNCSGLKTI